MVKKYWLFGPLVEKISYNYLFTLFIDIEDDRKSKEDIRKAFVEKIGLQSRRKEIENGEIL